MSNITIRFMDGSKLYADQFSGNALDNLRNAMRNGERIYVITNPHANESTIISLDKITTITITEG